MGECNPERVVRNNRTDTLKALNAAVGVHNTADTATEQFPPAGSALNATLHADEPSLQLSNEPGPCPVVICSGDEDLEPTNLFVQDPLTDLNEKFRSVGLMHGEIDFH